MLTSLCAVSALISVGRHILSDTCGVPDPGPSYSSSPYHTLSYTCASIYCWADVRTGSCDGLLLTLPQCTATRCWRRSTSAMQSVRGLGTAVLAYLCVTSMSRIPRVGITARYTDSCVYCLLPSLTKPLGQEIDIKTEIADTGTCGYTAEVKGP